MRLFPVYGCVHCRHGHVTMRISFNDYATPNTFVRKYVQAGNGTCTDCPAGKHQATEGSISCDNCEAGKYKADAGVNTACDSCEAGK